MKTPHSAGIASLSVKIGNENYFFDVKKDQAIEEKPDENIDEKIFLVAGRRIYVSEDSTTIKALSFEADEAVVPVSAEEQFGYRFNGSRVVPVNPVR